MFSRNFVKYLSKIEERKDYYQAYRYFHILHEQMPNYLTESSKEYFHVLVQIEANQFKFSNLLDDINNDSADSISKQNNIDLLHSLSQLVGHGAVTQRQKNKAIDLLLGQLVYMHSFDREVLVQLANSKYDVAQKYANLEAVKSIINHHLYIEMQQFNEFYRILSRNELAIKEGNDKVEELRKQKPDNLFLAIVSSFIQMHSILSGNVNASQRLKDYKSQFNLNIIRRFVVDHHIDMIEREKKSVFLSKKESEGQSSILTNIFRSSRQARSGYDTTLTCSSNKKCNANAGGPPPGVCNAPSPGTGSGFDRGPVSGPSGRIPCGGNPVSLLTGKKFQVESDIELNVSATGLSRVYLQSKLRSSLLGNHWILSFDSYLDIKQDLIALEKSDGTRLQGIKLGGMWFFEQESYLYKSNDGYVLKSYQGGYQKFDQYGNLLYQHNKQGDYWSFEYKIEINAQKQLVNRRLVTAKHSRGLLLSFEYNSLGYIRQVSNQKGIMLYYTYNAENLLSDVQYPDGTTRSYYYNDTRHKGALTELWIEGQLYGKWVYDNIGRAISSEHAGGVDKHLFSYNEDGSTTLTNPLGKNTTYHFDTIAGKQVLKQVEGHQSAYCAGAYKSTQYDSLGFDDKVTDWQGNITDYDYNDRGLIEKITVGYNTEQSVTTRTQWHPDLSFPIEESTATTKTTYIYDKYNRVQEKTVIGLTSGLERKWQYQRTYNDNGLVKTEVLNGPSTGEQDITTSAFDSLGNLVSITNAYGRAVHYGHYNILGQPGYQTDANGVYTEFKYDLKGRLSSQTKYLETPRVTQFTYNAFDQVIETTLPDGNKVIYSYDDAYRRIAQTNADGTETVLTLDNTGNVVKTTITDKYSRSRGQVFDGLSQVRKVTKAGETKAKFDYDPNGNVTREIDGQGNVISYSYDALNRKVNEITAKGVTYYQYNHQSKLTQLVDANGNNTHYRYNDFGDLIELISPDTGTTSYQYDQAGNVILEIRADGNHLTVRYDLLNRPIEKKFTSPLGKQSKHVLTYDNCDYGTGLLCKVTDNSGSTFYGYDASGNRYREIVSINGQQYITQRKFDIMDRLVEETYPSGNVINYQHNAAGQITDILLNNKKVINHIEYDEGNATRWKFANGQTVNRQYDLQGRISEVSVGNLQHLNFDYSANDNIVNIANITSDTSQKYGYDALSRLIRENSTDYAYDALGNRTEKIAETGDVAYAYDSNSNRLNSAGQQLIITDVVGNITQFGDKHYVYNAENRLSVFNNGQDQARYQYNYLNQRVNKQVNLQVSTNFVYNQQGSYAGRYQGLQYREYIYLNGMPVVLIDGDEYAQQTQLYYVANDQLGRPQVVSNQAAEIVWQANNHAFRRDILVDIIELNLGFPGQYYDEEKDSWYNWHRDYDANLGRYLQSDPIGIKGGINTYLYANANSLRFYDFTGMAPCSINKLKNCIKQQLGIPELATALAAITTSNIVYKPRAGIAGGGNAGNKTSIVSTVGGKVNIKFPPGVRVAGTRNVIRAGGRIIARLTPGLGALLLLYDANEIHNCWNN